MKHVFTIICCSLLILSSCNSPNENKPADQATTVSEDSLLNTLSEREINDGWELLFDGETTTGWHGFNLSTFPDKGWHVDDGTLMIEYSGTGEDGFGGDIVTDQVFKNFDWKLDWKISKGGNSGMFFNIDEADKYEATWHVAHEIQILDEFGYDSIHNYTPTLRQISGALYDLYTPLRAASKPVGEWNTVRIRLENGHLQHWLNNVIVIDVQLWTDDWKEHVKKSKFNIYPDFGLAKEGHIGLQDHGQQVWFRNIKILKLQ